MHKSQPMVTKFREGGCKRVRGLSLIELMVAMTVSLAVLSGVLTMMMNSMQANASSVKSIRLNQEMRAALDLMVRDLRRAGYRSRFLNPDSNPDATPSNCITHIGIGTSFENTVRILDNGTRIEFKYDANQDCERSDDSESFGFKLDAGVLKYTKNSLAATPVWEAMTDPSVTTFTKLSFCFWPANESICLTEVPAEAEVVLTGPTEVSVHAVRINMTAHIKNDTTIERSITETVRVRNDRLGN